IQPILPLTMSTIAPELRFLADANFNYFEERHGMSCPYNVMPNARPPSFARTSFYYKTGRTPRLPPLERPPGAKSDCSTGRPKRLAHREFRLHRRSDRWQLKARCRGRGLLVLAGLELR